MLAERLPGSCGGLKKRSDDFPLMVSGLRQDGPHDEMSV